MPETVAERPELSVQPRLSVVIPARNALRWLPGAIASIGGRRDVEIILIDDGSTDGTGDYLRGIAACDARIHPVAIAGEGPAAARNAGLALAQAPLVAFLDADDRWRPGKLAQQLELHRLHPELTFSFTDHRRYAEDGTELPGGFAGCPHFAARHAMRHEGFVLDPDAQAQIYAEPLVATSTVMANAALLRAVGGFNAQLPRSEDWDLWLHLAACGPIGCLPRRLTDRLVRTIDPLSSEGVSRRLACRRVADAYAAPATALDPEAARLCRNSRLSLEADGARLAGRRARAAMLRLSAFAGGLDLFGRGRAAAPAGTP